MELTFYLYDPVTFAYTEAVEVETAEDRPENSSGWPPPECETGQQAYFNGDGWVRSFLLEDMTPERVRTAMLVQAANELKRGLAGLNVGQTPQEVETFAQQYAEAQTFMQTGETPVFIAALAQARSESLSSFAQKIVDKASTYNVQKARILAAYQLKVKAIEADETPMLTQELLKAPSALLL